MTGAEFVERLNAHGCDPKRTGPDQWVARCPAHEDRVASLSIGTGQDDRVLISCHAGCDSAKVVAALGKDMADLFVPRGERTPRKTNGSPTVVAGPRPTEVEAWQTALRDNEPLRERLKERRGWSIPTLTRLGVGWNADRKRLTIPVRNAAGDLVGVQLYQPGGEPKNLPLRKGMPRDLFPRPEDIEGDTIWLVEGEPDAITAHELELPGVAIPGVSFAKRNGWASRFKDRRVVICFDCDEEGRKAAAQVATHISPYATEVKVLDLDQTRSDKYDLTDFHLEAKAEARPFLDALAEAIPPLPKTAVAIEGALRTRRADLSRVQPLRWAWKDWVLLGYLNLLVGDEGAGKGVTLCRLIGQWTRGRLEGDLKDRPARVLLIGDEDGFDAVWTPRLIAAEADLDLIDNVEGDFDVRRDLAKLKKTIQATGVRVVVFDQLLDNLGVQVDDWKGKQVRHAIEPIRRLMGELDVAMFAALHTNKAGSGSFRQRMSGSQAFNALSRSSMWVAQHPHDENLRVLIRGKGNYSAPPRPYEFEIDGKQLDLNGHVHTVPHVIGFAPSEVTLTEVLQAERMSNGSKAETARGLIEAALNDGQAKPSEAILGALKAAGIARSTGYRAAKDLGVEMRRGGFQEESTWRLPGFRPDGEEER